MLVAVSDTHRLDDPALTAHLRGVIESADCVLHAGDFTTEAVVDAFEDRAKKLVAVAGNTDASAVKKRLPETATTEWGGTRFLLAHGHRQDATSLSLLARQEEADVIVTGHTHRPVIDSLGERTLVNPGSYADPRGNQAAYAYFERKDDERAVRLRTPAGDDLERKRL